MLNVAAACVDKLGCVCARTSLALKTWPILRCAIDHFLNCVEFVSSPPKKHSKTSTACPSTKKKRRVSPFTTHVTWERPGCDGTIIRMTCDTQHFYQMGAHGRLRVSQLQLQRLQKLLSHLVEAGMSGTPPARQAGHTASQKFPTALRVPAPLHSEFEPHCITIGRSTCSGQKKKRTLVPASL